MRKVLCILLVILTFATILTSCENVDPNVKKPDAPTESDEAFDTTKSEENGEDETGYKAYGDDEDTIVTVDGVEVNADAYALRAYELVFLFAQKDFSKIDDIPVDVLVQFAFCHLYYENLYEMPHEGVVYKDAKLSEIKDKVEEFFGKNNIDLKKSVLYNTGKKKFEMWQPGYGTDVYYTIDSAEVKGKNVVISATFFNEKEKDTLKGALTITVKVKDGKVIMSKLETE